MIKIEQTGRLMTIYFEGHFDTNLCLAAEPEISEAVTAATTGTHEPLLLHFDIEKVTFVASSFIRLCVRMARELGAEHFKLVNSSPFISKTFKIAGLDQLMA